MNERSYQVTANQAKALRNFNISEERIHALNKTQASELLTQLIEHARERPVRKPSYQKSDGVDPLTGAKETLAEATTAVMQQFGLRDTSELREVHVALIQETARQIYGLRYWIGKSNGYL